jgi:hypothetical protein
MVGKDPFKIKWFIWPVTFKPPPVELLVKRTNLLPDGRLFVLKLMGLNQLNKFMKRWEPGRSKIRFRDDDRIPDIKMIERLIADNEELTGLVRFPIPGSPPFTKTVPCWRCNGANLGGWP